MEDDDEMVTSELEAAEALAALFRYSAARGGGDASSSSESEEQLVTESIVTSSQDQAIEDKLFCGNTSTMVTSTLKTEETVRTVGNQLCSTSYQSNSSSKLKQNLTKAEKEARSLRRVLANRESARQTIRRRQAMYLELTKKASDLSEENENLKKQKELAVEAYNSLKGRNESLKLQMAKIKKAEPRKMQEEPESSTSSATMTTPIFLYNNHPSLVPFFWPSIPPSSNVLQYCLSQIPMHHGDEPCLHQGQEEGPGTPFYVMQVPWLFPFPSHNSSVLDERRNDTSPTHQCSTSSSSDTLLIGDNYHHLSSNLDMTIGACDSTRTTPLPGMLSCLGPRNREAGDTYDHNSVSALELISQGLLIKKNNEPNIYRHKKADYAFAASKARKRRKELMKLKNIHL